MKYKKTNRVRPDVSGRAVPVLDRFFGKVQPEPNTGCWLWDGAIRPEEEYSGFGYGYFHLPSDGLGNMKTVRVHRWSYEHFVGPIPKGLHVLHRCGVSCCVNPDHLYVGKYGGFSHINAERKRKRKLETV